MGTADEILELIDSWIKQRERCADELMKLAKKLQYIRKKCNIGETLGSSYSVVGAAGVVGGSIATLVTAGAAAPAIAVAGAVISGVGFGVSVTSKIAEHFLSSGPMEAAKDVETKSNEILNKIEELFRRLKAEVRSGADADEEDRHVLNEMIAAMARRIGLSEEIHLSFLNDQPQIFLCKERMGGLSVHINTNLNCGIIVSLTGIILLFTYEVGIKKIKKFLKGGIKQAIKLSSAAGFKTTLSTGGKALLGAAGGGVMLAFSLPEAIDNWTDMIKNNHVTEASKSLRDAAASVREESNSLKRELQRIQKMLKEIAERQQELERECQGELERERPQGQVRKCQREQEQERPGILNTKTAAVVVVLAVVVYLCFSWKKTEDHNSFASCALRMALLRVESDSNQMSQISELISKNKLDVFLTTQTGLGQKSGHQLFHQTSPEGFSFYSQAKDSRGGGLAIQFSDLLQDDFFVFDSITTFQYLATELQHPQWKHPVLILLISQTTSSTSAQLTLFLTELQSILDQVTECYDSIMLTGDFNLPPDDEASGSAAQFEDLLRTNGLIQHNDIPGQRSGVSESRILSRNLKISALSTEGHGDLSHYTTFNVQTQNLSSTVKT